MSNALIGAVIVTVVFLFSAQRASTQDAAVWPDAEGAPEVVVLGIAQDGGYPQAGCRKQCCQRVAKDPAAARFVVSLAIVDPASRQRWLLECTPDFPRQLHALDRLFPVANSPGLDGIFLTHAHVGHYAGLIHLGREVIGANTTPVFVMPRFKQFLEDNGPWSQLVELQNIDLQPLAADQSIVLNDRLSITPIVVPHRDEFSETVGFRIAGPNRSVLFIPDIDKWERWERRIEDEMAAVDIAYLDATFFADGELPNRAMSEIPHPFVVESIERFGHLPATQRTKVRWIHLNHTNPLLDADSGATQQIRQSGMSVAEQLERISL